VRKRSGFSGVTKLRKTLRRVDPEITKGLKDIVSNGAASIARDMAMMAPVDDGDLARSISYKMGRDGFTAVIGPGANNAQIRSKGFGEVKAKYTKSGALTKVTLRNKDARWQLYKALWVEFGTKTGKKGSSAQPARPFLAPAMDLNRGRISRSVSAEINRILTKVAQSGRTN
jgi:HK97 gp10 family phage protein